MERDIQEVLLTEEQIQNRIDELGKILSEEYRDKNPVVLGVMKGVVIFYADMIRRLTVPCQMDFMWISSYEGTGSSGNVLVKRDISTDIKGRHVLILEDIFDTGNSLSFVRDHLLAKEPASLKICTLPGIAKREVYGNRVAELARISPEAMKMEVERARKRIFAREKRKQEQIDLTPASQLQRRNANRIPYDNVKSARAEEYIIAAILLEPAMVDFCGSLAAEQFSVPLFGKVYRQVREQHAQGGQTGIGSLGDLSSDEMSHIVGIYQNQSRISEQAFRDCVSTVLAEHRVTRVESADDLMALRDKMKERKGIKA